MEEQLKPLLTMDRMRQKHIWRALTRAKGDVNRAAEMICVSAVTIYREVRRMGMNLNDFRQNDDATTAQKGQEPKMTT